VIASLVVLIMGCQLSGNQTLSADSQNSLAQYLPVSATTQLNGVEIELEVAETPEQQAQGLMYRTELGDKRGMLFAFSPPRPVGFWMKNTLIPLDIIYLKNQIVTTIHHNVPPCEIKQCPTYVSKGDVDQVIELAAGRAQTLGIKIGDRINVRFLPQGSPQNQ
jgi:uncharacterized membrane protein (UPF0127 family)